MSLGATNSQLKDKRRDCEDTNLRQGALLFRIGFICFFLSNHGVKTCKNMTKLEFQPCFFIHRLNVHILDVNGADTSRIKTSLLSVIVHRLKLRSQNPIVN